MLVSLTLGALPIQVAAQGEPIEVGVRSTVQDTTYLWSNAKNKVPGDGGHGRIYGILAVRLIKAPERLVKPVDEKYMTSVLMNELEANGFKEFVRGQTPDILITASYGRGELTNPYMVDTGEVGGVAGGVSQSKLLSDVPKDGIFGQSMFPDAPGPHTWAQPITADHSPPTQTITGDWGQLYSDMENGHEANLQKASFEKLFIRITAWEYPRKSSKKPHMLWKTIVAVDDPANRDLNVVAATMLHAGAPYFDKLPRRREVLVNTNIPDTKVDVGPLKVGEPFNAKLPK